MMNNLDDTELERLRQRVQRLEQQLADQGREANDAPPPPPMPEIGMGRRAMNFMYNVGNRHAAVRNFLWALNDSVKVVGAVGGVAVAAAKATPAAVAKAKGAYAAAAALAAANPVIAGVAAVAIAGAATERAARYEDEYGNRRHSCAIL
jgi:hypothetical protein